MPDKYVCDCGFTTENYIEKCPECGATIIKLDEFEDLDDERGVEKYAAEELPEAEANEDEDAGIERIRLKKAA